MKKYALLACVMLASASLFADAIGDLKKNLSAKSVDAKQIDQIVVIVKPLQPVVQEVVIKEFKLPYVRTNIISLFLQNYGLAVGTGDEKALIAIIDTQHSLLETLWLKANQLPAVPLGQAQVHANTPDPMQDWNNLILEAQGNAGNE